MRIAQYIYNNDRVKILEPGSLHEEGSMADLQLGALLLQQPVLLLQLQVGLAQAVVLLLQRLQLLHHLPHLQHPLAHSDSDVQMRFSMIYFTKVVN